MKQIFTFKYTVKRHHWFMSCFALTEVNGNVTVPLLLWKNMLKTIKNKNKNLNKIPNLLC